MDVHVWETPIEATWQRANRLEELRTPKAEELIVRIIEENTDRIWSLQFTQVGAFKLLSEQCAEWSKEPLPPDGGFFTIVGSPWFEAIGLGDSDPDAIEAKTHYVISCQEGILEVVANDCTFE